MQNTREPTNDIRQQICIFWPDYHNGHFGQFWRFGPCYLEKEPKEDVDREREKELALDIVLEKSGSTQSELLSRLQDVEEEARATYHDQCALNDIDEVKFREMMAIDGCFYLLVAFSILGEGMDDFKLEFPDNHRFLGIGCVGAAMEMWLSSMFLVGNQIPFVVLKQLMELRFFKELIMKNKWKQPLELAKRAVHMLLIAELGQKPVDLIHCLRTCMLGTKSGSDVAIPIMGNSMGDEVVDVISAEELRRNGIAIAALENDQGSRGIYYEHGPFNGVLHLPVLMVDRYTALMVECLHKYEIAQKARGIKPESTCFLKLLSELIRTEEDVKLFSSRRVILGRVEALPGILSKFDDVVSCDCEHLRHVRRQIKKYAQQQWWISVKRMIGYIRGNPVKCFKFPLQFLQTYFTILACYEAHS